jgi:hypothetical protein
MWRQEDSKIYRIVILVAAIVATLAYGVAFLQADRGRTYYDRYVEAAKICHDKALAAGGPEFDCNLEPSVRIHLNAHRNIIALGEPFLNLAVALTLLTGLTLLYRRWLYRPMDPLSS